MPGLSVGTDCWLSSPACSGVLRHASPREPHPPFPTHCSCPGIFSHGCGSMLVWEARPDIQAYCYACSKPGCSFKEWVVPPRVLPEIEITVIDRHRIQVDMQGRGLWSASVFSLPC